MNLRSLIALILSILVIILGALLPTIVASRQDAAAENRMLFKTVDGIHLQFARGDLTMSETLSLVCSARDKVEIPQELTTLKTDKLKNTVTATAIRYRQADLLFEETRNYTFFHQQSLLAYGKEGQSAILWEIIYGSSEEDSVFHMTIDDQTGAICSLSYTNKESIYEPEELETRLSAFISLFLSGLGEEFYDLTAKEIIKTAEKSEDGSSLSAEVSWENDLYGKMTMTFFVTPSGFYTNINP